MSASQHFSSLSCEIRIKEAKNIEYLKSTGKLFVRHYLPARNNRRIRLDTGEIPAKSDRHVWNESFSLECNGADEGSMDSSLKNEAVVFELRWRNSVPVFGKTGSSHLLGRAEIPWKEILESPNMVLDKWITMVSKSGVGLEGVKQAKLQVGIRVRVQAPAAAEVEMTEIRKQRRRSSRKKYLEEECGCKYGHGHGCTCGDYNIFALVAALEGF